MLNRKNRILLFSSSLSIIPISLMASKCNHIFNLKSVTLKPNVKNFNNLTKDDFIWEGLLNIYEIVDFKADYYQDKNKVIIEYKIKNKITKKIIKYEVKTISTPKINGDNIDDIANNISIDYKGNKWEKLPSEVNNSDFDFSNFDKSKYNVDMITFEEINDKEGTLKIKYRLKTNDNLKISKIISKVISGFKKNISQPPQYEYDSSNNYYSFAEGLKGEELFDAIYQKQKEKLGGIKDYGYLYKVYESAFLDRYFEKNKTILDVYSENPFGPDPYEFNVGEYEGVGGHPKPGSQKNQEGNLYNREHVIPRSWFNRAQPTHNDAHFIWPTDKMVNQWRGNFPHYNVSNPTKTSKNGTKIDNSYCEPIDYFKGDFARAYFYFQITHQNGYYKQGSEVFKNVYPYFHDKFLNCYYEWAKNDKVDQIEIDRNNDIANNHYNGLRNPFIDYPNLPELIWGKKGLTFKNYGVLKSVK